MAACGHKTEIGTIPTNGVIIELGSSTIEARQVQDCASVSDALKKEHTLQGHVWSEELSTVLGDVWRSCTRGLRGTRRADALPIDRHTAQQPFTHKDVHRAMDAIIVGCWWLLREIEVATLNAKT